MTSKEEIISNIYHDLETGYGSIRNTFEQANKKDPSITLEDVRTWMSKHPNKQRRPYKSSNSYTAPFPRFEYQIDIMDMIELQKSPTQPRYALVVIDIFSKFGDVEPMYRKDSDSVLHALNIIFKKMGYPMSIYSDDDGAFKSKVKEFLDGEGINQIVTLTHANVVERWIRTLKNGIHDRVRITNANWEDMDIHVVKKYINTIHSNTNHTPKQAHDDKKSPDVIANLTMKNINKRKYKNISVGDEVKIYNKGKGNYTSRKETHSRWSDRTYKVVKIDRDITLNTYYILEGLRKQFNRHELLLTD